MADKFSLFQMNRMYGGALESVVSPCYGALEIVVIIIIIIIIMRVGKIKKSRRRFEVEN